LWEKNKLRRYYNDINSDKLCR